MIELSKFLKNNLHLNKSTICHKCAPSRLIPAVLQKVSTFIYNHSQDPTNVMIAFNAIAIFSSHIAQRNGLKKSNRENKDYLIEQENKEMWIDAALSLFPSILIKKYVDRKVLTGAWTTPSQRKKMLVDLPTATGMSSDDIYETFTKIPITKKCKDAFNFCKFKIATNKYIPKSIREKISWTPIKAKGRKFGEKTVEALKSYDKLAEGKSLVMRNGSALDDIGGFRNGLNLMATLSYSILAATVIMPILKNILTNISYKKQLAEIGETPENIRRKKRFAFNENPVYNTNSAVFSEMSASLGRKDNTIYHQNLKNVAKSSTYHNHSQIFSDMQQIKPASLKV